MFDIVAIAVVLITQFILWRNFLPEASSLPPLIALLILTF